MYTNAHTKASSGTPQAATQPAINAQLAGRPRVASVPANVIAMTIAADGGSRQPAHSARRERGSDRPQWSNAAARRAINHRISITAQVITAAIAARLANTLSPTAATATIGFNKVSRLITSSRYRTRWTRAAALSVTPLANNDARTWAARGAGRAAGTCAAESEICAAAPGSMRSTRPQRGITR